MGGAASETAPWYIVRTNRHREQLAQTRLRERGVTSYLPMLLEWPPPAVGNAIQPMFPGYLFVQATLERDFATVAWTPGVRSFLAFSEGPVPLDVSVVEFLRSREGPDGIVRQASRVGEGTKVLIREGPFQGLTAVVERRLPARQRVLVLLTILQRETRVELPERLLTKA